MNDVPLPDDELLSAYLDDEVSAVERARVDAGLAARADVRARLEALRAARAAVSRPATPAEPAVLDRAVAGALAAFDADRAAGGAGPTDEEPSSGSSRAPGSPEPPPTPTSLADARARRDARRSRILTGVAAAIVVLVVGTIAGLGLRSQNTSELSSAAAPDRADDTVAGLHNQGAGAAGVPPAAASPGITSVDLGAVADLDELRVRLGSTSFSARPDAEATAGSTPPAPEAGERTLDRGADQAKDAAGPCEAAARQRVAPDAGLVLRATASLDGRPVVVLGFAPPSSSAPPATGGSPAVARDVVVLDAVACTAITTFVP